MSKINKAAVLNPFNELTANILNYIPRATTSEFGIVAIGSGINVDDLGRIYLDTQEYSDRLSAIEAQAASALDTQQTAVAAAIAQVNLTQSQTITALTLEVANLKTNLTDSITATQTDLINRADQLAQNVVDITDQLAQDKAAFTQEIQDALVYLENAESVASALRTPRKINGTDFDGRSDITTNAWGATRTLKIGNKTNSINGSSNIAYSLADIGAFPDVGGTIQGDVEVIGNLSVGGTISATLEGNAGTATKLQTPRTINGVSFDGSKDITLPLASTSNSGTVQLNNTLTSTSTEQALTAAQGKALNDTKLAKTENAVSASKLQTSRTISLTGGVTGSVSFDGSANASIATTVTGLGAANGIATLDSNGQVPSTQLPSFVDDVLEYESVAAFPTTGESGKIYVETAGNTTYRWGGTGYVKITSGEVSSVAGKVGVVTLTKADVGLTNVDNTTDSSKSVASAAKLTTARTINGSSFNGSANITTANWGTARTLTLGSTGKSVNGSADVSWSADEILPTGTNGQVLKHNGTSWVAGADNNTTYSAMTAAEATTGTATTARVITPAILKSAISTHAPVQTSITGNAASASKLQTARSIAISGAVIGTATSFDGTADIAIATTAIDGSKISTGTIPAARIPTLNQSTTGNAATATKLATARAIGGVLFDGTSDINLPGVNTVGTQSTTGNAATATKLQTARTIGGVSFDGTANINLPGVNTAGNQSTTGNAATATSAAKWSTARTLTIGDSGKSLDGSGNVSWSRLDMGVPKMTTSTSVGIDNAESCIGYITNTLFGQSDGALYSQVYSDIWKHQIQGDYRTGQIAVRGKNNGTWQAWRTVLDSSNYNNYSPTKTGTGASGTWGIAITGNAATATKLATARTINGVSFNGTANITIADSTKLPLAGGTLTGKLTLTSTGTSWIGGTGGTTVPIQMTASSASSWHPWIQQKTSNGNGFAIGQLGEAWYLTYATKANIDSGDNKTTQILSVTSAGVSVTGTITASSNITAYSDARLKDNITKIPDALNKLNQLKGVTYTRKDLASDKQYAGLIAQDVQEVLPEAVAVTEDDIIAVDYNGIIGLLVEAVKELETKVAKLEGK